MTYTLLIQLDKNLTDEIKDYYRKLMEVLNNEDSGIDLVCPNELSINVFQVGTIDLGIRCAMVNNETNQLSAYYLYPRSSLSKTPLMLANHVGIIDMGYRGNIMAAVKYVPTKEDLNNVICQTVNYLLDKSPVECKDITSDKIRENVISQLPKFTIKSGTRLVQICAPNLDSIEIKLVDNLSQTSRGTGGFGSTNKSRELL